MAIAASTVSVAFGRFQVLPHRRELLVDGQPLKLGGRAYDVLVALIEAHGEVVSKDALMARVWPGRIVEDNALQAHISALRAAFRGERELIRTVAGRGYQFIGDANPRPATETTSRSRAIDAWRGGRESFTTRSRVPRLLRGLRE